MKVSCRNSARSRSKDALTASFTGLALSLGWLAQAAAQEAFPRDVIVQSIANVVAAGEEWQLVWQGTNNADGVVASPDGGLLFAQEQPRRIGKLDAAGNYSIYLANTRGVGSLSMDRQGRLWGVERSCTDPGRRTGGECTEPTAIAIIAPEGRRLADSYNGAPLGRLNDLIADDRGGAYFTAGVAYYVDAQGRVSSFGDGLQTNGIMLSRDERTLYVTNREVIVAFDVAPDGSASNRRDFGRLEAGSNGDGMAIDNEGRLYVTSRPGVQVFGNGGEYLGVIPTPRNAISAAFAGPDKRFLYIVGSGAALGPDGGEFTTADGVRNNAKTIYRIRMRAEGFSGRPK